MAIGVIVARSYIVSSKNAMWGLVIAYALILVAFIGVGRVQHEQANVQRDQQSQRRSSIVFTCSDQNQRHNATIRFIHKLTLEQIRAHPALAVQARHGEREFDRVIDTLAPVRNCQTRANRFAH